MASILDETALGLAERSNRREVTTGGASVTGWPPSGERTTAIEHVHAGRDRRLEPGISRPGR
jgi:hypothetical protein